MWADDLKSDGDGPEFAFKEGVVVIPPYPDPSKLIPVPISTPHARTRFDYFIDPQSLQFGIQGRVVRLTTVIQAKSGAQNIYFEGYRCDSREHITYAYGTAKKQLYKMTNPQWKKVNRGSGIGLDYRRDYLTDYLCHSFRYALKKDEILNRIRHLDNTFEDSGHL